MIKVTIQPAPPVIQPPDTVIIELDMVSAQALLRYIGLSTRIHLPNHMDFYNALRDAGVKQP